MAPGAAAVRNGPSVNPSSRSTILRYSGHLRLRQRLLLATLSGRPVRIGNIRTDDNHDEAPGLADYEISLLRLFEKVTNGSTVEINYTGTALLYKPGVITGGKVHHECPTSRGVGYFLEPMIALAPFAKTPVELTLTGVTNDNVDTCVDSIRTVTLPTLTNFLPETSTPLDLAIAHRGAPPLGGGQVTLRCPVIRSTKPVMLTTQTPIKRIRGIAYAARVSPLMANRVVDAARALLSRYIPDVYIYTDVYKGRESGRSPGFGLSLVAERSGGGLLSAECAMQPRKGRPLTREEIEGGVGGGADGDGDDEDEDEDEDDDDEAAADRERLRRAVAVPGSSDSTSSRPRTVQQLLAEDGPAGLLSVDYKFPTPEDLGVRTARLLLSEIRKGGCVDSASQWLAVLMMALGPEDVSKIRVGTITNFTVGLLRDVRDFLGVTFKVVPDVESGTVLLSCMGSGYVNVNKNVT